VAWSPVHCISQTCSVVHPKLEHGYRAEHTHPLVPFLPHCIKCTIYHLHGSCTHSRHLHGRTMTNNKTRKLPIAPQPQEHNTSYGQDHFTYLDSILSCILKLWCGVHGSRLKTWNPTEVIHEGLAVVWAGWRQSIVPFRRDSCQQG
jgi:hypothetical protein